MALTLNFNTIFAAGPIIIDHTCTDLSQIPEPWIVQAKKDLHIGYGHTSHGSQLTIGMTGLARFKGKLYAWQGSGGGSTLDLSDPINGAGDLGAPDRTAWADATRDYLNSYPETNVIMWSWCGQVSWSSPSEIKTYLTLMTELEEEFPNVAFVYMTGHLDGTGESGRLNQRNQQIRDYCRENNKTLYDFADIESYDPDGNYYLDKYATDGCGYDSDGNRSADKNWARDWQDSHKENVDWYRCQSAHSEPLNANRKAYAAWWLFARLAGWEGSSSAPKQNSLCPDCAKPLMYIAEYKRWYCEAEQKYMDEGFVPAKAGKKLPPPPPKGR
ncbi:MAG: hypothetical protein A2252_01090 [Elusimicrobia bacterium RIFOXYA2_FULL_39_19]|nr:MAG: hypothetical protein A2252_01090 [Elusimicrobia bacterium RIFOXYA2_FULL_39_19]